jgi:hypothetical protein
MSINPRATADGQARLDSNTSRKNDLQIVNT